MAHAWRSLLFGLDGWRHYLKSGYDAAAKRFDDAPFRRDLTGVRALVTGANQGIGFEVTRQLASQGATVTMVCRDRSKGEAALERLREERLAGSLASVADWDQTIEPDSAQQRIDRSRLGDTPHDRRDDRLRQWLYARTHLI